MSPMKSIWKCRIQSLVRLFAQKKKKKNLKTDMDNEKKWDKMCAIITASNSEKEHLSSI